jgi:membrane protease YdiL (CAAX protease family)
MIHFSPSGQEYGDPVAPRDVPGPRAAVLFVAGVAVVFFVGGITLEMYLGQAGLLAAEWLLLLLPALLFVRLGRFDARETLSLRMPPLEGWMGSVLMVAGALPVAWGMGWLETRVLPVPPQAIQSLEKLVTASTPASLAWLLFLLAITPAICEEAVFRGVLLGGTRTLPTWRVVVLNGVVFGAFHLSFETPVRFLPTAWLGIVLAWTVLRTRSVWTGVLMHFLNNGAIVLMASVPVLGQVVADPDAAPPPWLIPLALLCLAAGFRLLARLPGPPGADAQSPSSPSEVR